jgi:hypothetical protein
VNNSGSNNCTFIKIEILAVPNLLNNFQLIIKVDLLWPKWLNYALKFQNGKVKVSWVSNVKKKVNNSGSNNCTFVKIEILAVPNPLNIFQLIIKGDCLWPNWLNCTLKFQNGKVKVSWVSNVKKKVNNSGSKNCTFVKIEILAVPNPLNIF